MSQNQKHTQQNVRSYTTQEHIYHKTSGGHTAEHQEDTPQNFRSTYHKIFLIHTVLHQENIPQKIRGTYHNASGSQNIREQLTEYQDHKVTKISEANVSDYFVLLVAQVTRSI
jgi:hypothetical protein